jgi:hypothetical protein
MRCIHVKVVPDDINGVPTGTVIQYKTLCFIFAVCIQRVDLCAMCSAKPPLPQVVKSSSKMDTTFNISPGDAKDPYSLFLILGSVINTLRFSRAVFLLSTASGVHVFPQKMSVSRRPSSIRQEEPILYSTLVQETQRIAVVHSSY